MAFFSRNKTPANVREADTYVSELKSTRRKRRNFLMASVGVLVLGLFAIGVGWVVTSSSVFQIQHWEVSGNHVTDTQTIREFLNTKVFTASLINTVLGFQNIVAWPEDSFENNAPELPRVKSIHIDKNYLKRTVEVSVEERVPFGIWCADAPATSQGPDDAASLESSSSSSAIDSQKNCFWFDADGVLLDPAPYASGNLIPVVHDYSGKYLRSQIKISDSDVTKNIISMFNVLDAANLSVREVRLENRDLQEIKVLLRNGPELYFSLRFSANESGAVIASLKKNGGGANPRFAELQYVDFRVEHRAYYK